MTCLSNKVSYPNEVTAEKVKFKIMRKQKTHMRMYLCRLCGQWHLTRSPKKSKGGRFLSKKDRLLIFTAWADARGWMG